MDDRPVDFNGINARSGRYLVELTPRQIAALATGEKLDAGALAELNWRAKERDQAHYGLVEGLDASDLAQTGWGVVFAACAPGSEEAARQAAIREALAPLLDLRRAQATRTHERRFQVYAGATGVRGADSKQVWLARNGAGPGPVHPDRVPSYLLLVGDPRALPFRFQSQLAVQRAVGRIHFDTVEEYASYARSVVEAESGRVALARRASFFGVANPDDPATQASSAHLVGALADSLGQDPRFANWQLERTVGKGATRAALGELLGGRDRSALLFTASHGLGFPNGDPLQLRHQGALLCQDWPGPVEWGGRPIPEDFYLAGEHLGAGTNLLGTLAFLFACFGAGTPEMDEFSRQAFTQPTPIAPHPFLAALPKAMLGRPKGGALAVVGHVERAWGHSFLWPGTGGRGRPGVQIAAFESTFRKILTGLPIGAAMEDFEQRYAELSCDLAVMIGDADLGDEPDPYALAELWTANNDARGYAIVGDPAVRLAVGDGDPPRAELPEVTLGVQGGATAEKGRAETGAHARIGDAGEAPPGDLATNPLPPAPSDVPTLLARVEALLAAALADAARLEVSTWVADDPAKARWDGDEVAGAELHARTRISPGGSTAVCLARGGLAPDRTTRSSAAFERATRSSAAFERATLVASADGGGRDGAPRRPGADDDGASDEERRGAETGAHARIGEPEWWKVHTQAVEQAQRAHAELLKALAEAAATLARATR